MRKRRNPDILDTVQLVVIGGLGIWAIKRLGILDGFGGGGKPGPVACSDGRHHFRIEAKDWSRYIRGDGRMDITWRISHCGPSGRYWAGVLLTESLTWGGSHQESQELFFDVQGDQGWSTWDYPATLQFGLPNGNYDMVVYVADAENNTLAASSKIFLGVMKDW